MPEHRDCGTDAAAYVLGALEPAEADAFREHLAGCAICRDEVSAFQQVVDMLPLTAPPQPVPPELKTRVMAEVNAQGGAAVPDSGTRRRSRWRGAWRGIPRSALAAAAAVAVLVIALGAIAIGTSPNTTRVYAASVTWPGAAHLRVTGGRGELVVTRMPAPPANKVYEVWLQRGNNRPEPTSALFSPTTSGSGSVDVPGNLHGVSRVMVTPEPVGGSSAPTHPAVLVARLS